MSKHKHRVLEKYPEAYARKGQDGQYRIYDSELGQLNSESGDTVEAAWEHASELVDFEDHIDYMLIEDEFLGGDDDFL